MERLAIKQLLAIAFLVLINIIRTYISNKYRGGGNKYRPIKGNEHNLDNSLITI